MDQSKLSLVSMKLVEPESDEKEQGVDEMLENLTEHSKDFQKLGNI